MRWGRTVQPGMESTVNSHEYCKRAEALLTNHTVGGSLPAGAVEEAAVWAQLATAAAITEAAEQKTEAK